MLIRLALLIESISKSRCLWEQESERNPAARMPDLSLSRWEVQGMSATGRRTGAALELAASPT